MQRPRTTVPWLGVDDPFPDVEHALGEASGLGGLLAAGADLSPQRLLQAYRAGIFPWYSDRQPILWWSPDPRMVLMLRELYVPYSLLKTIRRHARDGTLTLRMDTAFDNVVERCRSAERDGQTGTWITDDIACGYGALHRQGDAHSFEAWQGDRLVGGGYGVSIGRMFYGESMFTDVPDASKVALVGLASVLDGAGFEMIDCQQNTRHLASFGAREIPRALFCAHVRALTRAQRTAQWPEQISLDDVAAFATTTRRARHGA